MNRRAGGDLRGSGRRRPTWEHGCNRLMQKRSVTGGSDLGVGWLAWATRGQAGYAW